ncbi:protein MpUGT19 [Marchantia polymorpha subsp. ruderalis]|uniref:Glycosyltransferase n=2 Tax=Marchantia polymorpha TaxID=3197 RepID=A0AAF6BAN0_MARPO|nr:hypothetical protein MARPO_0148s0034 [Marchantia polymorpha]BBN09064.1 hypothetical protein Mp_4g16860 [Marchantia polymorpha subsp. ruderalis]|eukprot:PTQ29090.1 hypothetical protein MARPO_0148s0034 [Marchantia polymorpha]
MNIDCCWHRTLAYMDELVAPKQCALMAVASVWMVPISYISHVRCYLQLAKLLASHGIAVTLFCTKDDSDRLHAAEPKMCESWKLDGLDLRLRLFYIQQPPELADGENGPERLVTLIRDQEQALKIILTNEAQLGHSRPSCVISDPWLPGVREAASELKLPSWVFIPFSTAYTSTCIYLTDLASKGILNLPTSQLDEESQEMISLPGLPLVRICDIDPTFFKDYVLFEQARRNGPSMQKAEVLLLSTFEELEHRAVRELKKLLQYLARNNNTQMPQIWTIGPTFSFVAKSVRPNVNGFKEGDVQPCLRFLDKQPPSSVVYVAFGNDWNHTPEQVLEIAYGLETSQQPFLCVLHYPRKTEQYPSGDLFQVIPPELINRTKGRGLFVQDWAPQLEILAHPSTGGFITHCGQNSILESISMGIPLLAWPLICDQMINCRSLVDEVEVALEICKGADGSVDRREVERKVRALFHSEEGTTVRQNAQVMRQLAIESVGIKGSTYKNMQALVALIKGLSE